VKKPCREETSNQALINEEAERELIAPAGVGSIRWDNQEHSRNAFVVACPEQARMPAVFDPARGRTRQVYGRERVDRHLGGTSVKGAVFAS